MIGSLCQLNFSVGFFNCASAAGGLGGLEVWEVVVFVVFDVIVIFDVVVIFIDDAVVVGGGGVSRGECGIVVTAE